MSVENSEVAPNGETTNEVKPVNGEHRVNGLTNGHASSGEKHKSSSGHHSSSHKSSSKDKHRDRDRDKDKSSSRDHKSSKSSSNHTSSSSRDKDKDKEKSGEVGSSSSSKDKDKDRHSSSHKSSRSDKDRERDKERHRDKDKEKDRHRDKDKSKDHKSSSSSSHDKSKEKDKEKDATSSSGKEKSASSSSDKDKNREHRGDRDKDKHKSTSSSSSSKDKHSSSSSSSKHKDGKDRDRHHHSSSSKHKSSSSSRSSDKDRRDRDSSSKTSKSTTDNKDLKLLLPPPAPLLESPPTVVKREDESSENDDNSFAPFTTTVSPVVAVKKEEARHFKAEPHDISQASSCDYSMSQFHENEASFPASKNSYRDDDGNENENGDDSQSGFVDTENDVDYEDVPLLKRKIIKESEDEDEVPLIARKKVKTEKEKKAKKKKHVEEMSDEDEYEEKPKKKKVKKEKDNKIKQIPTPVKMENQSPVKGGRKKKEEDQPDVWKWWEEEKREDGVKWNFLEHKGPVFAPEYEPLPSNVNFYYDKKVMRLTEKAEEIASFYARMIEHDYTSKKVFNDNFFKDWRHAMSSKEKDKIKDLKLCDFKEMHAYYTAQSEKNKNRTKEQKLALKAENEALAKEYGFCTIDGHREKIGNFKIEPPGLFRGRGEHPKMGKVKQRVMPADVMINCSKNGNIPQPPKGHKWREVRHDNSVTWLASWTENVQGQVKYIMLNPSSKLKGEKDWQKYETARRLHKHIDKIRSTYREEWKSKEMRIRQRAVALYFIDKLALRAGNEKDEDQADTVGCCSLRVEHIQLFKERDGKENVVTFDFLGKDSIRYYNEVEVEKRVFKNLELFKENKKEGDDLFDRLNTVVMNEHLRELMDGLTAKVFRTYNASYTLQSQLDEMTDPNSTVAEKFLSYNRANRAVAILCNHQRAVPKTHAKSMETLKEKIRLKREAISDCEVELKDCQKAARKGSVKEKLLADKKKKQLERLQEQLQKLELQETDKDENKTIALSTSKLNYLDPRISVAWCKKHGVPIEKIYNKTQRDKFRWAIDMATEDYVF